MSFTKIIHTLGASGSGTTTLGKAISIKYGHFQFETDDYFWLPTDPPYTTKRLEAESQSLLEEDMSKTDKCVLSGSMCGWGDVFIENLDLVIYVNTTTAVRIERLHKREFSNWGDRILEGGDMYNQHKCFLDKAGKYDTGGLDIRSRAYHMEWLKKIKCKIIEVDGTKPIDDILKSLH